MSQGFVILAKAGIQAARREGGSTGFPPPRE